MSKYSVSCPRACVAVAVGVLFGLIALTLAWVATYHPSPKPIFVPSVVPSLQSIPSWQVPVPSASSSFVKPVTLLFVGDIMLDRNVAKRSQTAHDLAYPFRRLPVGWFDQVDYAIANLEGPVTDKRRPPEKTIDFQFDPAVIPILKEQGIDAVSQANNHTLDQGRIGAEDSRARLQAADLLVFGDQVNDGEIALANKRIGDQRIVFVGFNTTDNPLDLEAASTTLAKARIQTDYIIVFMHWGLEYQDHPSQAVIDQARWLIDHGADIVIGGHPHWYQGIDVYKGKPIVYSLGNFIFDQDFSKETLQGLAVKLTLKEGAIFLEPIPLQIDLSQPRIVDGHEGVSRLKFLADISEPSLKEQIMAGEIRFEGK